MEIQIFNSDHVDPDQTSCSAASDLGLHCLLVPLLWDTRHKWINDSTPRAAHLPWLFRTRT